MLDAVIARLKAQVPDLNSRVEDAASFAELMRSNKLSSAPVAAYVLPLGLLGGKADAATGAFTQVMAESVGVILVIRGADPQGQRALDKARPLIMACVQALAGWTPDEATLGVFELKRGALLSMQRGTFVYQIDFAINDQLRIFP